MSRVDLSGLEAWLAQLPRTVDVAAWKHDGLDIWPVFKTALVGLAIHIEQGRCSSGFRTGSAGWRAGVLIDHYLVSTFGRVSARGNALKRVSLTGRVMYYVSGGHGRSIDGVLVTPSLDAVAVLLADAGQPPTFFYEDIVSDDPLLDTALHAPAIGMRQRLQAARRRSWRQGVRAALSRLLGLRDALAVAAGYLSLNSSFLSLWFTRHMNVIAAIARECDKAFDMAGTPSCVVLLNGCSWSTAGLAASAKRRGVAVVEVQHGVESPSAVTSRDAIPHFASFNTAPNALISWETAERDPGHVLAAGPIGLALGKILQAPRKEDQPMYTTLRTTLDDQARRLAARVGKDRALREVVVTLQPGDDGIWLTPIIEALPDTFFWVRRHSMDVATGPLAIGAGNESRTDQGLARNVLLEALLTRADVHLTRFSGATLEAAAMGLPTVATHPYSVELFADLVPKALLTVAIDADAIRGAIRSAFESLPVRSGTAVRTDAIAPFVTTIMERQRAAGLLQVAGSVHV